MKTTTREHTKAIAVSRARRKHRETLAELSVAELLDRLSVRARNVPKPVLVETVLDLEVPTPSGEGTRGRGHRS